MWWRRTSVSHFPNRLIPSGVTWLFPTSVTGSPSSSWLFDQSVPVFACRGAFDKEKSELYSVVIQEDTVDCCGFHLAMPQQRQQMRSLQLSAHRGGGRCCLRWSSLSSSSPPLMLPPGCPQLSDAGLFILPASPAASPARHCAESCRAVPENVSQNDDGNAKRYL